VVQAVAEFLGDLGLARDARQLLLEPRLERHYERLALSWRTLRLTSDPFERFAGDRSGAFGLIKEPAPPAGPAEGEHDPAVRRIGGDVFEGGVTVALDDAPIAIEQLQSMDGARPSA
jgi:hypothetical protein